MRPFVSLASLAFGSLLLAGCGGETAAEPCTLKTNLDGSSTLACPDGSRAELPFPHGTCSVTSNGDGTSTIRCEDGSEVLVRDGEKGLPGEAGVDGDPGRDGATGEDGSRGSDGEDGTDGRDGKTARVQVVPIEAGEGGCETGGLAVYSGIDDDGDGVLDDEEIDGVEWICDGVDGVDGQDGTDGEDGTDGTDGRDGSDGQDGFDSLVRLDSEPPGERCAEGGVAISSGRDLDRDGVLGEAEVEETRWVCNPRSYVLESWLDAPAQLGAGVQSSAVLRARVYGVFDPFAGLRWRLTATDELGQPVPAVAIARPASGEEALEFPSWTAVVSTDGAGVAWLDAETGFTADGGGLLGLSGMALPLGIQPPSPGTLLLRFDLVRLSDGAVLGGATGTAAVLTLTPRVELVGLNGRSADARSMLGVNGRLPLSIDAAALVRWRFTVRDGLGAPRSAVLFYYPATGGADPATHATWTEAVVTDSQGRASWPAGPPIPVGGRSFQTLDGEQFWFSFALPAGSYSLEAELLDDAEGTVLGSTVRTFTVVDLPTEFTFQGFTGLQQGTRALVVMTGRLDSTADGSDIVRWRLRLTDDASRPVVGFSFYFDPASGSPAAHADWTDAAITDAAGEVFLGDPAGFPASLAQVREGIGLVFSILPPVGSHVLALELVRVDDGAVIASGSRTLTVAR